MSELSKCHAVLEFGIASALPFLQDTLNRKFILHLSLWSLDR